MSGSARVKILFDSHVFAPSIGGIERLSELLAGEFVRAGHEVRLVTRTPGGAAGKFPFELLRRPSPRQLTALVRWCDVFFQNNISLRPLWPLLLTPRPWVVAHHVWIPRTGLAGKLKRRLLRHATCVAISEAIAAHLATPSVVIPNAYDESVFRRIEGTERERDLVFVGRLVPGKGAAVLLEAVALLRHRALAPTVTIVGRGEEHESLRALADSLRIAGRVTFAGALQPRELALLLNRHRIIVVPSLWKEPFGVVALEGIACGCVAVASEGGGLRDAVGPCGLTFPNGDVGALADALQRLLVDPVLMSNSRAAAPAHLLRHTRAAMAQAYLRVMRDALLAFRNGTDFVPG
jgi:glycosyltransferase involved in cell wall biosynthesis